MHQKKYHQHRPQQDNDQAQNFPDQELKYHGDEWDCILCDKFSFCVIQFIASGFLEV